MSKRRASTKFKAILFDLGKVILHFDFDPAFAKLAKHSPLSAKDIEDYFIGSGLEVLYDGGKISTRQFYLEVKKALNHGLGYHEFKKAWNQIFTPNPEVVKLVRRLKSRYRLVLISNTNEMHFTYLRKKYRVLNAFDRFILSFKEKRRKPDAAIYRAAIRACRAKAPEIFYIDDRSDLTEAAKELGFETFTYKNNFRTLQKRMKTLGIF